MHITRKGKERVVDNNHITIEEVDSTDEKEGDNQITLAFIARPLVFERLRMREAKRKSHQSTPSLERRSIFRRLTMTSIKEKSTYQALTATKPSAFGRLGVSKKKKVQTPHTPIFNCLGDGGSHVNIGSNINTKKKETTSHVSV